MDTTEKKPEHSWLHRRRQAPAHPSFYPPWCRDLAELTMNKAYIATNTRSLKTPNLHYPLRSAVTPLFGSSTYSR